MGRCKRYGKEQLLDMLQEQCPNTMAKLPLPDTFAFQALPDGTSELRIGSYTKGRRIPVRHELWVRCGGTAKPWLGFDIEIDHKSFHGDAFFKKMTKSGTRDVYSDELKTMVAFVFVYCDKMEEFCDFQFGKGFKILIEQLKYMFPEVEDDVASSNGTQDVRTETAEASDADANADADMIKTPKDDQSAEKQPKEQLVNSLDDVLSEKPKKRLLSVETDEYSVEKKLRVE